MIRSVVKWLEVNWPIATPFLGLYSLTALLIYRDQIDLALFLIWLQIPVYFFHQFEEYILPGGFLTYFNKNVLGSDQDEFPLTKAAALWINIPIVFVAYPVSALLANTLGMSSALWIVYFSIINAAFHIGMFARKGYNPGFYVSLSLNIPVGLMTLGYITLNGLASLTAHSVGVSVALILQGSLMLYGLAILKPRIKHSAENA